MKMNIAQAAATVWLSAFVTCAVLPARADDSNSKNKAASENTKTFTGTLSLIDIKDRIITVKGFPFSKTFNLADRCAFNLADKKVAGVSDLRSGQRVAITYRSVAGVHVANSIAEERLVEEGKVEAISTSSRTLTLRQLGSSKTFKIPTDCKILVRNGKAASLQDVKVGDKIKVLYDTPGDGLFARQIEQRSSTFTGSVIAIDVTDRTLKAKSALGTKKFLLADGCNIVVKGRLGGELRSFRIGQNVNLSYDEVDGVNVVTRIAGEEEPKAVTATKDRVAARN
jgi:hypothetical protein